MTKHFDSVHFGTLAVHADGSPDPRTGAVMTPIYQTSTYKQDGPGKPRHGYAYSRLSNPTRDSLETGLANLEGGKFALTFGSGMAATDSVMRLLVPGDEVITTSDVYGGTYRLFTKIYEPMGIRFHFVDITQPEQAARMMNAKTKLIWAETPTNPLLKVVDIEAMAQIAHSQPGTLLCVDNTFASPYLQSPLKLGADIVMHSCTKYLGGHSDVIMGALVMKNESLHERLQIIQNTCGAIPGPQDCFLMMRGMKTLHLRMERHCSNAIQIARFLNDHPKVAAVNYPGLPAHPGHQIAKKQMRHFGGMISFYLKKDKTESAHSILANVKIFTLGESLGGVESLIGHPPTMTHSSIPREERIKAGLYDSMVRLSIGIEDPEDLLKDLDQALATS